MPTTADYYEILEIPRNATPDQIREAYRKLAKQYHPDLPENKLDPNSSAKFIKIQEAYDTLIDPSKKKAYDKQNSRTGSLVKMGAGVVSTMDKILTNETLARRMGAVRDNIGWDYNRMLKDMEPMFGSRQTQQPPAPSGPHQHTFIETSAGNLVCTSCGLEYHKKDKADAKKK